VSPLNRRTLLSQGAVTATALWLVPHSLCAGDTSPALHFPVTPRDRICVASYPFREFITGRDAKAGATPPMDLKNFAAHVKEKFGIDKIEPWTGHFPSTKPKYIDQFRIAVEKAGSHIVDIAVDGESSPYAPDSAVRAQAVAFSQKWIDIAVAIGSPSVRTNLPSAHDASPSLELTVESLRRVSDYAARKNVVVNLENDNPVSEDPFFLVQVIEKVNSPWLHALPDFANTLASAKDPEHAYTGVDAMFAHAYSICHVKDAESTEAGKLVQVDLPRTFAYLKNHGYKGYCSMEWDRPGDPYAGTASLIEKTVQLLS
jgi:sugar phosphate isomerase/epimerase